MQYRPCNGFNCRDFDLHKRGRDTGIHFSSCLDHHRCDYTYNNYRHILSIVSHNVGCCARSECMRRPGCSIIQRKLIIRVIQRVRGTNVDCRKLLKANERAGHDVFKAIPPSVSLGQGSASHYFRRVHMYLHLPDDFNSSLMVCNFAKMVPTLSVCRLLPSRDGRPGASYRSCVVGVATRAVSPGTCPQSTSAARWRACIRRVTNALLFKVFILPRSTNGQIERQETRGRSKG